MNSYIFSVDADWLWPVGAYLIIYRAGPRPIEIVAVTQGSRDIPAFLRGRITH